MSDVRMTINGTDYIVSGVAREEPVVDAIAALQLILLAFVDELRDRGAIDPQMLAQRLKGAVPADTEHSTVKGLVEVFGRRLEYTEKPAPETAPWGANGDADRAENGHAHAPPTMLFQPYSLVDRE